MSWRSEEAPLKYNGVVFNEMKGALYFDPDSILYREHPECIVPRHSVCGWSPAVTRW